MKFPVFEFKPINIDSKKYIESFTSNYEPYSDFNFVSLLSWNINSTSSYCFINDNLVIKLSDYMTLEDAYSVLGHQRIDETFDLLFSLTNTLKYVPEITVSSLINKEKYEILEDRDEFDYIYQIKDLAFLEGKDHKNTRNKFNNFVKNNHPKLKLKHISFQSKDDTQTIKQIFNSWTNFDRNKNTDSDNESIAIDRICRYGSQLNLTGVIAYIEGEAVGFSINEILPHDNCICHFQKASLLHQNLDPFITNLVSNELLHFGCKYVNWEQDLGIEGLRQAKMKYKNLKFLKKYQVKSISGTS